MDKIAIFQIAKNKNKKLTTTNNKKKTIYFLPKSPNESFENWLKFIKKILQYLVKYSLENETSLTKWKRKKWVLGKKINKWTDK